MRIDDLNIASGVAGRRRLRSRIAQLVRVDRELEVYVGSTSDYRAPHLVGAIRPPWSRRVPGHSSSGPPVPDSLRSLWARGVLPPRPPEEPGAERLCDTAGAARTGHPQPCL